MEAVMTMLRNKSTMAGGQSRPATAGTTLEFGRFRVLLRERQLLAEGAPIELGARAFELLLTLLEAEDRWSERSAFPHPVE